MKGFDNRLPVDQTVKSLLFFYLLFSALLILVLASSTGGNMLSEYSNLLISLILTVIGFLIISIFLLYSICQLLAKKIFQINQKLTELSEQQAKNKIEIINQKKRTGETRKIAACIADFLNMPSLPNSS